MGDEIGLLASSRVLYGAYNSLMRDPLSLRGRKLCSVIGSHGTTSPQQVVR